MRRVASLEVNHPLVVWRKSPNVAHVGMIPQSRSESLLSSDGCSEMKSDVIDARLDLIPKSGSRLLTPRKIILLI